MKKLIILIVVLAGLIKGSLQAQSTSPYVITTTGTSSWTCPANATSVTIEGWGGGGAGGVATIGTGSTANAIAKAGGGTGGSYSKKTYTNVTQGTVFNYTIGTGGASGGASPTQTIVNTNEIVAVGGTNGASATTISGSNVLAAITVAPSSGNAGDSPYYYGGNGGQGGTGGSGGGGGSAGSGGNGGNGGSTGGAVGGTQASNTCNIAGIAGSAGNGSVYAGAAGATGISANGTSPAGTQPGSGGAGGYLKFASGVVIGNSSNGGAGGAGKIVISWVVSGVDVAPTITFPLVSVTKNYGDANITTQTASSNSSGTISYSSSNSGVASVNASTGVVTLGSVGSATITASQAAAAGYLAGTTTYTVTVNPVLTASTPSPAPLYYEAGVSASNEATFTVTGAGLTNDVLLAPGTNVDVSLTSGSGFVSNPSILTVPLASFSGGTVTIYVRLRSGIQPGGTGTSSRTTTISSIGATTTTAVLGSGYITGLQITGFSPTSTYALGAGPGDEKSFIVRGNGLETTTQVSLVFGSNIEVTTTAGNYSTPITSPVSLVITPGAIPLPSIGPTTYYYRLKSGLSTGTYADATTKISLSADGSSSLTGTFTTKELQVTGTVNFSNGSYNVADGNELNINQNSTSATFTISPLGKVTLPDNTTLTSSSITLQSNAGGTATFVDLNNALPQTVTGTVQQYLTAERNWYTSSPITAGTAAGLNLGTSVQTYSESAKGWTTLQGTDALTNGKGYVSVATTGTGTTGTVSFNGTLNSGTIEVPVTRTESGSSRGFNLVANPYPSYLDWSLVTADGANANIGTTMWFRTKTGGNAYTFSTYNSDGNVAVGNSANTTISKLIPPMQAFWIRVNANLNVSDLNYPDHITSITFKNSMRAHKDVNGNTFKAPKLNNQQLLRLQISNEAYSDEAVVYFNANASNAFDKYDSQKMFENASALKPEIYTQIGTEQLVINGLNAIPYDVEIPLGYVAKEAGVYSISRPEMTNFESGTRIILKDKLNGNIETELSDGIVYNFNSDITAATTDRFSLIFRAPGTATGVNNTEKLNAQVFVNAANQISIIAEKCNYTIYNAVGMLIENGIVNCKLQTANCKLQTGVYVVRLSGNGKEFTSRVIIK